MLLSRARFNNKKEKMKYKKLPELDEFLAKRDYSGAISLLEFRPISQLTNLWLGYCAFHAGEYKKSLEVYEGMLKDSDCPPEINVYMACIYFFLGMYPESKEQAVKGEKSPLQNRLFFHVSNKIGDEKQLMHYHSQLCDTVDDQLSLASIHYLRSHYQEALNVYKGILLKNKNFIALNVYLAMCYYKLDYYDISQEVLQVYLSSYPESPIALNLKACNQYKLYNGKTAQKELRAFKDYTSSLLLIKDLISHNLVVFRDGDGALQILPALIENIPEARLNLIIFHLKRDDVQSAFNLAIGLKAETPQEYLLKAITYCITGYEKSSNKHLETAREYFKVVGESAAECDTIAGRQAMASAYFLMEQFDKVLIYLNSIKTYFYNDDIFNFNIGQALLACGNSIEAESSLLLVANELLKKQFPYIFSLARSYIFNGKAAQAWQISTRMKQSAENFFILRMIANDCYKIEEYYYSAKAFDAMERIEPNPEYWEGKRGAVVGLFKLVSEQKAPPEQLKEALVLLEKSRHPQVEQIANAIRKYCKHNDMII